MLGVGLPSSLHSLCFLLHQQLLPFNWTESEQLPIYTINQINRQLFYALIISRAYAKSPCFYCMWAFMCFLCVWMCFFWPAAFVCSSLSALRRLFASYWFLVCKATVSGTALICHCVRPTTGEIVGPLQAAVAVLPKVTGKRWVDLLHRTQTPSTISMDMGRPRQRNHEEEIGLWFEDNCTRLSLYISDLANLVSITYYELVSDSFVLWTFKTLLFSLSLKGNNRLKKLYRRIHIEKNCL